MKKNKKILHRQKIMETAAKPILLTHIYRFLSGFVNYKKGALDSQSQVINLPVACPWSVVLSGTLASSTTKTGRHDIADILLKVALSTQKLKTQTHIHDLLHPWLGTGEVKLV